MYAKRTTSYLLSFQGYPPIRRQPRHCRICQRVQVENEVTSQPRETGADHPKKPETKIKRAMAIEIRITVCEIFLSGWRSSQIIQRTQNGTHPPPFPSPTHFLGLRFGPSYDVLRKWCQNQGSTIFIVTSQKTEIAKSACEPK